MSSLFGTDGIRARFGEAPLDRPTVTRVGYALARFLAANNATSEAGPRVVVGGDTRASTPTLARWLAEGLETGGAHIVWVGVIPTPGVAWLCSRLDVAAGVAVSASHNPAEDNGIKLLTAAGGKWRVRDEAQLEEMVAAAPTPPSGHALSPTRQPELVEHYIESLRQSVPSADPDERPLEGLEIALDTSHGAASGLAEDLFASLGARPRVIGNQPNGENINRGCGSTHPEALAGTVIDSGSHFGVAFDGDADRAILVDETGTVRDGDAILYLWASHLARVDQLEPRKIVATTMSNLGLEVALGRQGIELMRCGVGDRTLVETLESEHLMLGGEQSGHIVHLGLSTTGDGLLTALQLSKIIHRDPRPLSQQLADFRRFPQILVNVPVSQKPPFEDLVDVQRSARSIEAELGDKGRLLLRYSGTEPLARVMLEGENQARIEELAQGLATVIGRSIGR